MGARPFFYPFSLDTKKYLVIQNPFLWFICGEEEPWPVLLVRIPVTLAICLCFLLVVMLTFLFQPTTRSAIVRSSRKGRSGRRREMWNFFMIYSSREVVFGHAGALLKSTRISSYSITMAHPIPVLSSISWHYDFLRPHKVPSISTSISVQRVPF